MCRGGIRRSSGGRFWIWWRPAAAHDLVGAGSLEDAFLELISDSTEYSRKSAGALASILVAELRGGHHDLGHNRTPVSRDQAGFRHAARIGRHNKSETLTADVPRRLVGEWAAQL